MTAKGRGAGINPPNRFQTVHAEPTYEDVRHDDQYLDSLRSVPTSYIPDHTKTIVAKNDSPDIPFRYSINPYRGCSHGCAYCYARPGHEYLGMNAGLDFESKIIVKENAPELFRDWLADCSWNPEVIVFSGVTDCYQPAERDFRLTQRCLAVALDARQPIAVITKNALITRDRDILRQMASYRTVQVAISLTTLDRELARTMEPRTSSPAARIRTIEELTRAGIPVSVMVAPIIPGLNDHEIPALLEAASSAGASSAGHTLLRLPSSVQDVFFDWLATSLPSKEQRVLSRIRSTREGRHTDWEFGTRMSGSGRIAEQIHQVFHVFAKQYGLDRKMEPLDTKHFRRPRPSSGQLRLF